MAGLDKNTPSPQSITLHQQSRVLEIGFSDGQEFKIPFELMRVYSPSAEVQGHGPGQEVLQTGKREVGIVALEPVGNYAVQPTFSDGHSSRHLFLGPAVFPRLQAGRFVGRLHRAAGRRRHGARRAHDRAGRSRLRQPLKARPWQTPISVSRRSTSAKRPRRVRSVFDSVAPKYDVMNDLMSAGLHRLWKRYTLTVANPQPGAAGARHRRWHGRSVAGVCRARSGPPGAWCTPTSTRRCCAKAATACSTWAWCCPPWCATPRSCRLPAIRSTSCRWPSVCAT